MKFLFLEVLMLPLSNGRAQNFCLSKETTTQLKKNFYLRNLQNYVKYKSKVTH